MKLRTLRGKTVANFVLHTLWGMLVVFLFTFAGCGMGDGSGKNSYFEPGPSGPGAPAQGTGTFEVTVCIPKRNDEESSSKFIPETKQTLKVTVTGDSVKSPMIQSTDISSGSGPFTLTVSDVPVGLDEALIQILDASTAVIAQRKHGFYMTAGATVGPGTISMGVAIKPDGTCEPAEITIPVNTTLYFENWDTSTDRYVKMNGNTVSLGPITKVSLKTQPSTATVYYATSYTFNASGDFNYDSGYGAPGKVTVEPPMGAVTGTVTESGGGNIKDCLVTILTKAGITAASGIFTIKKVMEGNQAISAGRYGYVSYTSNVTVTANTTTTHDITLTPYDAWHFVYSRPAGANFKSVKCVSSTRAWAVGDGGILVCTIDGSNWVRLDSGTAKNLAELSFVNTTTGWIVGDTGTMRRTTDGGINWTSQNPATANNLYGVSFVSTTTGWAVGASGIARGTTDGGVTWTSLNPGTASNLNAVFFANTTTGWAVGASGVVRRTTDGGATWTSLNPGTASALNTLYFIDSNTGWIGGATGIVRRTTDGGATWTSQYSGYGAAITKLYFSDSNKGWIVGPSGTSGYTYRTTNGGTNWSNQNYYFNRNTFGISGLNSNTLWYAGASGTLQRTDDGGQSRGDQTQRLVSQDYAFYGLFFADSNSGWVSGNLNLYNTTDGGRNWTSQDVLYSGSFLKDMCFLDSLNGWGLDMSGIVVKTSNGGANWTSMNVGAGYLSKIRFPDSNNGWIAGYYNVYNSTNGGQNWNVQLPTYYGDEYGNQYVLFWGLCFLDSSTGWASGGYYTEDFEFGPGAIAQGLVFRTTDSGANWSLVLNTGAQNTEFYNVYFVDSNIGWAVGKGGIIRKSTNGGVNWAAQASGTANALNGVRFFNSNVGWAVGAGGTIIYTTNGGTNWTAQPSGMTDTLYNIFILSSNNAWAAGDAGAILHWPRPVP